MGTLPYQEIKRLCANGMIDPWVERELQNGKSYGLSTSGYDVRIKQDLVLWPINLQNLINNWLVENKDHKRWIIRWLARGRTFRPWFDIASTIERFDIPDYLMPKLEDKSSWARLGLSIFNTTMEPGWKGWLTVELKNNGHQILHIKAGDPIGQMVFDVLTAPTDMPYKGKFQNQPDQPVAYIAEQ